MRKITPGEITEIHSRGTNKLVEICKSESLRLTTELKSSTDINRIRHLQGQIHVLEEIESALARR